ncbi:MAG: hypothetical protein H6937_12180 [Burkholderiales bacterium]|nr:hypothetical protein [Burkholderiales bacterium]
MPPIEIVISCETKFIILLITWIITCLGWYVSNNHAKSRELRKEHRSIIDDLGSRLDNLLDDVNVYYGTTEKIEPNLTLKIRSHFNRITGLVERLESIEENNQKLYKKLTKLFEAVTGDDFESANVKRGLECSEKCQKIMLIAEQLRDESENWFNKLYN